ncbi:hypothetical protein F2Q69_00029295 [Brassica cretica]|uniref:Uncharacterized protein n=1 Tax=Brassica cretica TaxID=69181 RepID=A0A8S9S5T0_BRACR|nr:hypothetical protein F2Q69_00029295 [Brassica cretica]
MTDVDRWRYRSIDRMAEMCSFRSSFCSFLLCFIASLHVEKFLICETLIKFINSLITRRRWCRSMGSRRCRSMLEGGLVEEDECRSMFNRSCRSMATSFSKRNDGEVYLSRQKSLFAL